MHLLEAEVRQLRAARVTLVRIGMRVQLEAYRTDDRFRAYSLGMTAQAIDAAEHSVFEVLNVAKHHLDEPVSDGALEGVYDDARIAERGGSRA